jgi:hypothetical protein
MAQTNATPKTSVSAEQLMSLPSLSSGLSTLPQAKSIEAVSLHFGIHTERAVEREEKVCVLICSDILTISLMAYPSPAQKGHHKNSRISCQ